MHSRLTQNLNYYRMSELEISGFSCLAFSSRRFGFERSGFSQFAFSSCVSKWYFILTWVSISEIGHGHYQLATRCHINRKSLSATKEKHFWNRDRACQLNCLRRPKTSLNLRGIWKVFEKKSPQQVRIAFYLYTHNLQDDTDEIASLLFLATIN